MFGALGERMIGALGERDAAVLGERRMMICGIMTIGGTTVGIRCRPPLPHGKHNVQLGSGNYECEGLT